MKPETMPFLPLVGLFALVLPAHASPAGAARAVEQKAQTYEGFVRAFKEAIDLNDQKRIEQALKKDPSNAILYFTMQCDVYVQRADGAAGNMVELMKEKWQTVFKSALLEKIERFRSDLGPTELRQHQSLDRRRKQAWGLFADAKHTQTAEDFAKAADAMAAAADAYLELGDKYEAAETLRFLCDILDKTPKKEKKTLERLVESIERFLEYREDWDWAHGSEVAQMRAWLKGLKRRVADWDKGAARPEGAAADGSTKTKRGDSGILGRVFKPGSKWEKVELEISLQSKPEYGISMAASAWPLEWPSFYLEGTTPKQCSFFKDGALFLERLGANKYASVLDPKDLKEKPKLVKVPAKPKSSYVSYLKGDSVTDYGFFLWQGSQQEPLAAVNVNIAPEWGQRKTALLFLRSASVLHGKVGGVRVRLYDENANGVVGEDPTQAKGWGDYRMGEGIEKPSLNPAIDSMRVGSDKRLRPFSSFLEVGEAWYKLRVTGNNEELRSRELDPKAVPTGTLAFKWHGSKKAKPRHLVVAETGFFRGAAFDIAGASDGIDVPIGTYEIVMGRVINGKPPRAMNAVVLRGDARPITVAEGKTTTLEMGAPFRIEFRPTKIGRRTTVNSAYFWVKDRYGAKFTCLVSEILEPELVASKTPDGKAAKVLGSWRLVKGQELNDMVKNYPGKSALHLACLPVEKKSGKSPRLELSVENPFRGVGGTFFLGVRQKKHKVFGKLEPIWK